jgi:hypothetical protein
LEGLRPSSPLCRQDQEEPQKQEQREEITIELVKEEGNDGNNEPREPQGEKQQYQEGNKELNSDNYSDGSDCSYSTSEEDDKDPRPAKRRKHAPSPTTNNTLTPNEPTSINNNDQHRPPQATQSPSAPVESAPVAEYQEWPFQGFLKRTRIRLKTTYNLKFTLLYILNYVHLPIPFEVLSNGSNEETPVEAATFHNAMTYSKVHLAASQSRLKRVRWTPEEDAKIVWMREDGCSWEEIHAALPHQTQGTIQVHYSTKLKK